MCPFNHTLQKHHTPSVLCPLKTVRLKLNRGVQNIFRAKGRKQSRTFCVIAVFIKTRKKETSTAALTQR